MSHYTVLVIGDSPEKQLAPFDENLRTEFEDKSEEFKEEYETKSTKEFYSESNLEIPDAFRKRLKSSKIGSQLNFDVKKEEMGPTDYFKAGCKYRGRGRGREDANPWFEVVKVIETNHPDSDVCFEGKISVRKISKPKEITLKDRYPDYDVYLTDWHGISDPTKQGWAFNPQAKWDWYQLGGRWSGAFILKPKARGVKGKKSWTNKEMAIPSNHVDQANKGDIDFDAIEDNKFEELSAAYDEFEKRYEVEKDPGMGYFEFGIENTGDRENYIPETREQYLKRRAGLSYQAILMDGKWYEKGDMGWWGHVSDEKDPQDWRDEVKKLIEGLSDDTKLSVYDCHI